MYITRVEKLHIHCKLVHLRSVSAHKLPCLHNMMLDLRVSVPWVFLCGSNSAPSVPSPPGDAANCGIST